MFSSNDTPADEYKLCRQDLALSSTWMTITHIDFCREDNLGKIPETISCRYNPGGVFKMSNGIMDNPGDAKYGFTTEQMFEGFKYLEGKRCKALWYPCIS